MLWGIKVAILDAPRGLAAGNVPRASPCPRSGTGPGIGPAYNAHGMCNVAGGLRRYFSDGGSSDGLVLGGIGGDSFGVSRKG